MKRILLFLLVTVTTAGLVHAKTYKIGMLPWLGFSPNSVAVVKGFWKDKGVDVETVNFSNCQDMELALEHKRVDIAHQMIGSWVGMYNNGIPIKVIAELDWSHGGDKIIVKKDVDISKLKGQTVGVYLNSPAVFFFLNKYLEPNQIKLSDIKLVELEVEGLADNFISGRFRAIVNFDPEALRAEREGNGKLAATSADFPGCIPEGYAARKDVLDAIPKEDLMKIFMGWIDAVKWIKDQSNWQEFKDILNNKTFEGDPPYSDEDLKQMLESVRIHDVSTMKERNKNGGDIFTYVSELRTIMKNNNMLKNDFKSEDIVLNEVFTEVLNNVK